MDFPGEQVVPRLDRAYDLLTHWRTRTPDAPFDHLGLARRDYRRAADDVDTCARALIASGVRPGDRVAVLTTPRPEFMTVFLALSAVGGVWVGLNPGHTRAELAHVIDDSAPVLLMTLERAGERTYAEDVRALAGGCPSVREIIALTGAFDGATGFAEFLERAGGVDPCDLDVRYSDVHPDEPALVIYTSGTTGRPKGALISHRAFAGGCHFQGSAYYHPAPACLANLPVDHVAGVMDLGCVPLAMGGSLHYMEDFDPEGVLALIESERLTMWGQIPTIFRYVMALPRWETADLSSLRFVGWGGAPMPVELVAGLRRRTSARLGTVYGLTESCVAVAYNDPDADDATLAETIGRPDPRMEFRIVDDSGAPVPDGMPGEIQLRNPSLMSGYLNLPDATAAAFTDDGFLRTGDVAIRRPDGNVALAGRLTEMFKSGGYNVYPREIEAVLEAYPALAGAAVVDVPDPVFGEVGVAYIETRPGVDIDINSVTAYCRERLARYKVPKRFAVVDALPRLPVGKIDRAALRARARAAVG